MQLGYMAYAGCLGNFMALAVWHLAAPYTLTTLGALLAVGYAISYKIHDEPELLYYTGSTRRI